ncbi:MAG TPA: PadR family transcriptional regulator [Vicinamibacteria bacterium]|nr:PadR family transcriptional regulator [Vicinamibacteria bacterium]
MSKVSAVRGPQAFLPLPDAELEILLALAEGGAHGYAVMRAVERRTGGRTRLGPGTLYAALKRLLAARLIEESGEPRGRGPDPSRRRSYRLSDLGSRVLAAELDRLAALVRHGRRRLRLAPAGGRP